MKPNDRPETGFRRALRIAEAVTAQLTKLSMACAVLLLAGIAGIIGYSVFMRYLFGQPQPWVDEAAGWLLVGAVMFAIPEVQRRGDHIGIDTVTSNASPRRARMLLLFGLACVLGSAVLFAREGVVMVEFSRMIGVSSNQLPDVPLWMIQAFVPIGFGLMALVAFVQSALVLAGLTPRDMALHAKEQA
jgi:TRAP-type C4-dicarboxylate transport system permease small subunit